MTGVTSSAGGAMFCGGIRWTSLASAPPFGIFLGSFLGAGIVSPFGAGAGAGATTGAALPPQQLLPQPLPQPLSQQASHLWWNLPKSFFRPCSPQQVSQLVVHVEHVEQPQSQLE